MAALLPEVVVEEEPPLEAKPSPLSEVAVEPGVFVAVEVFFAVVAELVMFVRVGAVAPQTWVRVHW